MYNLVPPLILILSLAGLIVMATRKYSRVTESLRKEERSAQKNGLQAIPIRVFTYQAKVLVATEKILRVFVFVSLRTATSLSRLSGKVKRHSQEVNKASDFVTKYLENIKTKKAQKRLGKEEVECIKMIQENPSNTEAYSRLGENYFARKNYSDAQLSFEQVLRLRPGDEGAQSKLKEIKKLEEEGTRV